VFEWGYAFSLHTFESRGYIEKVMRKVIFLFIIFLSVSFHLKAETTIFGHGNVMLGSKIDDLKKLIKISKISEEYELIEIDDFNLYLIEGFKFNRSFIVNQGILQTIILTSYLRDIRDKSVLEKDIKKIISIFDKKGFEINKDTKPENSNYKSNESYADFVCSGGECWGREDMCYQSNENKINKRIFNYQNSYFSLITQYGL
jgi:hypothetical protein